MPTEATGKPHKKHGHLAKQSDLPDNVFAFPKQRKEPLADTRHMRDSAARFDQVIDVSDADRALAFANIQKAAVPRRERIAEEIRADAVVVGASAHAGHRLVGSLAVRMVKAARWPVTVVP